MGRLGEEVSAIRDREAIKEFHTLYIINGRQWQNTVWLYDMVLMKDEALNVTCSERLKEKRGAINVLFIPSDSAYIYISRITKHIQPTPCH